MAALLGLWLLSLGLQCCPLSVERDLDIAFSIEQVAVWLYESHR